ncbi:MAG: hypothetical protein F6K50_35525, partial [Moorea sp. SIO3I7]|nr:hypothetical protein [Moorena sp. SIO3I7]
NQITYPTGTPKANNQITLAYWPRFANNLQPNNLGLLATLREQPSTK